MKQPRPKPRSDAEIEQMTNVVRNDPTAARIGRVYSGDAIEKLEEQMVPWLKRRRRWRRQQAPSP